MNRYKGKKGYISFLKKFDIIFILVSAMIFAAVYLIGSKIWNSKANIGTVVAVLSILPACKRLANLIVIMPFKGISNDDYATITPKIKEGWFVLCEMLFSTEERNYSFDHVVLTNSKMLVYSTMSKDKSRLAKVYFENAFAKRQMPVKISIYNTVSEYAAVLDRTEAEIFESEKLSDYITSLLI